MRRPGEQSRAFAAFKRATKKRSCRGGGPLKGQVERWPIVLAMRNGEYYLEIVSHDANIDALKHTRRAAMQNSWIWGLLLALALCAALTFFLIEVWQIVEFIYR